MDQDTILQLALSAGLGLLVGLQREWAAAPFAGIRTFALITLLGTVAAQLSAPLGPWIVIAGLVLVGTLMIVTWYVRAREAEADPGHTTVTAALLMYLVGAVVVTLGPALAVALGASVAVLLHFKEPLHRFVKGMGAGDLRAIMQLSIIALVVLPALPNRTYGPYAVLNPFQIWLMVVLICGISVAGYVAYRIWGARAGALLAGVLGGLISSTATTVGYATRSRRDPDSSERGALIVVLASAVVFPRVIFELAVVAPGVLVRVVPPLLVILGAMAVLSVVLYRMGRSDQTGLEVDEDPTNLRAAIAFGLLYAAVLFAVAVVRHRFDGRGLFVVAGLSGLTDMDAITLSTARLIQEGRLEAEIGWRMILVGAMSNLAFKAAVVATLGSRRLLRRVGTAFVIAIGVGIGVALLWPG